jgi:cytochrome P450
MKSSSVPSVPVYRSPWLLRNPVGLVDEIGSQYGGAPVWLRLLPRARPILLVGDPDLVQQVWDGSRETYLRTGMMWEQLAKLQGREGIGAEGPLWQPSRDLLQNSLTPAAVRRMLPAITAAIGAAVERLAQRVAQAQKPTSLAAEMAAITHAVLGRAFFGGRLTDVEAAGMGQAIDASFQAMQARVALPRVPDWLPMPGDRVHRAATRRADDIVYPQVYRAKTQPPTEDVISILAHADLPEGVARNNVLGMFTAGSETTASALLWALVVLQEHPDIAARLQAEVDQVVGGPGNPVLPEHLSGLTYTGMVLSETLRLYPPAWMLPRGMAGDARLGDVALRPGDTVVVSPYLTHRLTGLWRDPLRFDPQRWAPDQRPAHKFSYFPFGGGIHRCLGAFLFQLEAQLALAALHSRFNIRVRAPRGTQPHGTIALKPRHQVLLDLTLRDTRGR